MRILCSTNDKFVMPCGVMLTSLFSNNRLSSIEVFIMSNDLNHDNRNVLKNIVNAYDNTVIFLDIGSEYDDYFKNELSRFSINTFFRIVAIDYLPIECDKIIYLDADVIIRSSLSDLWNLEIDNYALAAVDENIDGKSIFLGYESKYSYFNAGVMLLNLKYWRDYNVKDRVLKFLYDHNALPGVDQDALNGVLYAEWFRLPLEYNLTSLFLGRDFCENETYTKVYNDIYYHACNNPVIVHFTGENKPWIYSLVNHPYKIDFQFYLSMTIWKKYISTINSNIFSLKDLVRVFLSFFGINYYPFVAVAHFSIRKYNLKISFKNGFKKNIYLYK